MRIPDARELDKALRETKKASRRVLIALNKAAGQVMAKGNYSTAEALAAKGREIQEFQAELEILRKRWIEIKKAPPPVSMNTNSGNSSSLNPGKTGLARGLKTPQREYRNPILLALHEFGGSAFVNEVLERVLTLMKEKLKEVDFGTLGRGQIRWKNTAMWEKKMMIADGLLKKDSKKGVWELTKAGEELAKKLANTL